MEDRFMSEAVKILLDLSNKIASYDSERMMYRESYRAKAAKILLESMMQEQVSSIAVN
jgi:hypothetical protein